MEVLHHFFLTMRFSFISLSSNWWLAPFFDIDNRQLHNDIACEVGRIERNFLQSIYSCCTTVLHNNILRVRPFLWLRSCFSPTFSVTLKQINSLLRLFFRNFWHRMVLCLHCPTHALFPFYVWFAPLTVQKWSHCWIFVVKALHQTPIEILIFLETISKACWIPPRVRRLCGVIIVIPESLQSAQISYEKA